MQASTNVPLSLSRKQQRVVNARFLNCVEDGVLKKIKRFLNEGANINAKDDEGLTALHIAVTNKNLKVMKILLERGATIDIKNNNNETPLNIAERLNETSIIQLLNPQLPILKPSQQNFGGVVKEDQEKKKLGSAVHGHIYQLKLLMLFLHRGVSNKYSFRLGTEIEEAQKFDDLVFEYTEGGAKKYRLLQAKHRLYNTKKITSADLLTVNLNNDNFSLAKYFFSYMQAKEDKFFEDGMIKDVIISTNIGLDLSDLEQNGIRVQEITSEDNILGMKSGSKRYRFHEDLVSKLKSKIVKKKEVAIKHKQFDVGSPWRLSAKGNSNWSNIVITDQAIAEFLKHLVFAVNQPNEQELGKIIKDEIGQKLDLDLVTTENTYNKLFVKMLNWFQGKESARFLSWEEGENFFQQAKRGMPFLFNIKDPVSSFTGRVEQLQELHNALMKNDKSIVLQSVVISGLGGVGKSELARKYISLHSQDYNNNVLWMNAESRSTLSESFHRLALDKLRISTKNAEGKEKDINSLVEDVYRFFCKGKCIFVFDNAEKFKNGVNDFLPSLPENMNKPHVLITSRNRKWPNSMRVLQLETFSENEAMEVIKKSLNIRNDRQTKLIKKLAEELQFFPLALQQAIAYIRSRQQEASHFGSFQINEYLEKYKQKTSELLDFSFPEDSDDNYTKTTLMTWGVTLDQIKKRDSGDLALKIMNLIAYFAPENIPTEWFLNLVDDKERLGSALELLKQYSLVDLEQTTLNIHRLVQQVTRMKLTEENSEEEVLRQALSLFKKESVNSKCLDHAISIWKYSSKYTEIVLKFLFVSTFISAELINSFRFEESFSFGMQSLQLLVSLKSNNPDILGCILATCNNIAGALLKQGKYDMALNIFQRLYKSQETIMGPNQPECLTVKSNIAKALLAQGKYNEALRICKELLSVMKSVLGENHPDALVTKHNIAAILIHQGRYNEASTILQEVSGMVEATAGKNDHKTLNTKNTMAAVLFAKGNYTEALQNLKELCDIKESSFGKNHLGILHTRRNIAGVFFSQGKYSQALEIMQEVLPIQKQAFGDSHPDVLNSQRSIVEVLRKLSKYEEALKICRKVLSTQKNTLGSDHPDVIHSLYSEACILNNQGKYSDALQIYQKVLSKWKVILGPQHRYTLLVSNSIAVIFSNQGNYEKAMEYYQEAYTTQESTLGQNHPDTLNTRYNIGMVLYGKKEFDKALNIFQKVYNTLKTLYPDHPGALSAKNNTGLVLFAQKKLDEALKTFREVLICQEAILGKEHHSATVRTKNNIAAILLEQGKQNEALRVLREALKGLETVFGPKHPDTVRTGQNIKALSAAANELVMVVRNNNLNELQHLIKMGADVNTKDDDNTTLLHYAVNNSNIVVVNLLLKSGADITQITNKGNTPLHIATSKCLGEIVEVLLQHAKQLSPMKFKDFINAGTTAKSTAALHIAAQKDNLNIVKLLLKHGAVYNVKNKENKTPSQLTVSDEIKSVFDVVEKLFDDVKKGNKKIVGNILKKEKAIVNARDNDGATPLFCAIQNGLMGTAQFLLENGADPTLVTNKGNTPLHIASSKGNNEIVKALLDVVKRYSPNKLSDFINAQTTVNETTALHVASNAEVVKSLLLNGAVYNIKNKYGKTPHETVKNDLRHLLKS